MSDFRVMLVGGVSRGVGTSGFSSPVGLGIKIDVGGILSGGISSGYGPDQVDPSLANAVGSGTRSTGGGIIFPYTPTITFGNKSNYSDYDLVHTNYAINAFVNSRPDNISISAPFYNQTKEEASYTANAILFLRTSMKMDFGVNATGAPPPILRFSAYGPYNLQNVPVVISSFNTSYPPEPDYVDDGNGNYFPTEMTLSIELIPQYSAQLQSEFSLKTFASGNAYSSGYI